MISHPTHPRSILSLQECGKPFIEELRSRLPAHFEMILNHGNAVLLDRHRFEIVETKETSGIFTDDPYRTFQDITLFLVYSPSKPSVALSTPDQIMSGLAPMVALLQR